MRALGDLLHGCSMAALHAKGGEPERAAGAVPER